MPESQKLVLLTFSGLLGLVVGSFLNVCIFRLPRNCMSIVRPRSRCIRCLNWIVWYDNLPVVSWLVLGGKCRTCKAPISPRYLGVELLTGALFAVAGWRNLYGVGELGWHQAATFAVQAWFIASLIVCTFIDLDFEILPDEVTLSGIVIGLLVSVAFPFLHERGLPPLPPLKSLNDALAKAPWMGSLVASVFGALAGAGSLYLVGAAGKVLFRKRIEAEGRTEAMGLGDVKLLAMFGAVLGWGGMTLAFMVSCFLGAFFGIGKWILVRRMGYVPFGPFLAIGAGLMVLAPGVVHAGLQLFMDAMLALSRSVYALLGHPLPQ
jgi:leader peptidase (prepilin peptidase)/N-methyltransferase